MRLILFITTLLVSTVGLTQTNDVEPNDKFIPISVVSDDRDTLWLARIPVGFTIAQAWKIDEEAIQVDTPVIIFKEHDWIIEEWRKKNGLPKHSK
jgi:hypothetical protein